MKQKTKMQAAKRNPASMSRLMLFTLINVLLFLANVGETICYGISMQLSSPPAKLDQRYYIDGSVLYIPFNFSHSPVVGADCSALVRYYSVSVNGAALPAWMTMTYNNNNGQPTLIV